MTRVILAILLLGLAGCSGRSLETPAVPRLRLDACTAPGIDGDALCGTHEVAENRAIAAGRRIQINVLVLPALGTERVADPIFYFAGGPGASATQAAPGVARTLLAARRSRDLVFVDARGTGRSHPLVCPGPPDGAPLQRHFDDFMSDTFVRECLAAQDADVRFYTQPIAMDDIDEVRAALGYDRINLYGASGGTRQAQLYARRHPASVRSMVLHGVQPMDAEMPLAFSRALDHRIARLLQACRLDRTCGAAYPDLESEWERSKRRFEAGPVEAEVEHSRTHRRERVRITRGVYADGVRHLLYDVRSAWQLPAVIHAAAAGDFGPFARRELAQSFMYADLLAGGMFLSSTCAEDVRFIDEDDIRRATDGTFLADYRVRRQQAACRIWPNGSGIDADFQQPLTIDVPVLILSGDTDVATPPADAERVARALPNVRHIVFPNQGHGFASPACAAGLIAAFIVAGSSESLDAACVDATRRPPFVPAGR